MGAEEAGEAEATVEERVEAEGAVEAVEQQSAAPGPPVEPAEEKREAGDACGVLV